MINQNQLILTPVLSSDFSNLKQQETLTIKLYQDRSNVLTLEAINRNKAFKIRINPIYFCGAITNAMTDDTELLFDIFNSTEKVKQYLIFSKLDRNKIFDFLMLYFM